MKWDGRNSGHPIFIPLRSLCATRKFASYPQSLRILVTAPRSTGKGFPETPSVASLRTQVFLVYLRLPHKAVQLVPRHIYGDDAKRIWADFVLAINI